MIGHSLDDRYVSREKQQVTTRTRKNLITHSTLLLVNVSKLQKVVINTNNQETKAYDDKLNHSQLKYHY